VQCLQYLSNTYPLDSLSKQLQSFVQGQCCIFLLVMELVLLNLLRSNDQLDIPQLSFYQLVEL
jgi:hypothetical protein